MIAVFLNYRVFQDWSNPSLAINNIITLVITLISLVIVLFTMFWIYPNYYRLREKKIYAKYSSIYDMVNLKDKPRATLWCIFFFMRRLLFVLAVVLWV
jgi:hypothetical protein